MISLSIGTLCTLVSFKISYSWNIHEDPADQQLAGVSIEAVGGEFERIGDK
jgi:hypothetical protein